VGGDFGITVAGLLEFLGRTEGSYQSRVAEETGLDEALAG